MYVDTRRIEGTKFEAPLLQFDYESSSQVAYSPYRGLCAFGPYDKHIRRFGKISMLVIAPDSKIESMQTLTDLLKEGWSIYPGFERIFGVRLSAEFASFKTKKDKTLVGLSRRYEHQIMNILREVRIENYDIALVGIPWSPRENISTPYYRSKAVLTASGLPSQMITWEVLNDPSRLRYSLMNIAIAIYTKVGGRPWALAPHPNIQIVDCFIGIGMALRSLSRIGYKLRYVGFANIFRENGCYVLTTGVPGVIEYKKYLEEIGEKISDAISEYERVVGKKPRSIIIHNYKRTSRKERKTIVEALSSQLGSDFEYAIVRVTDAPAVRIFDFDHRSMTTEPGVCVPYSAKAAIVTTTGRRDDRSPLGTPVPIYISIEEQSPSRPFSILSIAQQVYYLSKIYWGGVSTVQREPVTTKYARLLASMMLGMWGDEWNRAISNQRLADKAWFI